MAHPPPASVKKKAAEVPLVAFDEDLWFGTPNPEAAETAAARSVAATAGRVVGAKPFPAAARRLADLARNEATTTGEFVQVLEQDPALSAKLLRMVNSAGFGLRQRCATVRHAVTLVGSEQLYRMATTAAVLDMFDAQSGHAVQILEHSAVVGAFCRYLGVHLSLQAEELFTAGMLHDIGKLMLLETLGSAYGEQLDAHQGRANALFLVERETQGFDHGVLAAHVLKEWNIPDPIPKLVAWHHEPTRAYASSTLHAALVQTVRLADALEIAMAEGIDKEQLTAAIGLEAANYLDISEAQLMAMYDELCGLRESTLAHARGEDSQEPVDELHTGTRHKQPASTPAEVPRQFPCVSCGDPSFGATCTACNGYVCPEHPLNDAGWCPVCTREYTTFSSTERKPLLRRNTAVLASVLTAACAAIGWTQGEFHGLARGLVGGLLLSAFTLTGMWIVQRVNTRNRFIRLRRDH